MSAMTWILQHLHYVHNYRRRKGRRRRGFGPSLDFATWYFPIIFVAKKIVYLVSSWKNEISPFLPTLRKSLASPGKFCHSTPPRYTTFGWSWTIGEPQWFDQVRLNYAIGSASILVICAEIFLWLAHQKFDWHENFWYNFGN